MATTETRSGFRLPWRMDDDSPMQVAVPASRAAESPSDGAPAPVEAQIAEAVKVEATEAEAALAERAATAALAPGTPAKRPLKFLADLTRAMQVAAESARAATLEQLRSEAAAHVEHVRERSTRTAADLRKHADEDATSIREWSKAEVARIREATESRIAERKSELAEELELHTSRISGDIERIAGRVAAYEAEMSQFFDRILHEDDPAEIAALAQNLPEPPTFDGLDEDEPEFAAVSPAESELESEAEGETEAVAATEADADVEAPVVEPGEPDGDADEPAEPSMYATAFGRGAPARPLSDFDAAEAEAAAAAADSSDEEFATIGPDLIARRLAGLPAPTSPVIAVSPASSSTTSSQVVVTGLVSVGSIAGFKRSLAQLAGVSSVGVSSGPDGEFVFTVVHSPAIELARLVPALPDFEARVTGSGAGVFHVTAHDPETA